MSVKILTMLQCYERQFTPWACSVASITILLNTWFSLYGHKTQQTQQQVLDISGQEWWTRAVTTARGVCLEELYDLVPIVYRAYGCLVTVSLVYMDRTQQNIKLFFDMLEMVLRDPDQQILVNFDYNALHDISTTQSGHISPILDMHRTSGLVCILDVDDETVPYWVHIERLIYSMTIQTNCRKHSWPTRGY